MKNLAYLTAFLKPFLCYSTTSFLKMSNSSPSSLLASLSLAAHNLDSFSMESDSFSQASRSATFLASSSFSAIMCFTLPAKLFFSSCKALQQLNNSSSSNLVRINLANTANFRRQLVVRPHSLNKSKNRTSYLRALHSPNSVSIHPPFGSFSLQGRHFVPRLLVLLPIFFKNFQTPLKEDLGRIYSVLEPD